MKTKEIRAKTESEILQEIVKIRKELINLRFQKASGQLQSTAVISSLKKDVAKLKTILTEKNIVSKTAKGVN